MMGTWLSEAGLKARTSLNRAACSLYTERVGLAAGAITVVPPPEPGKLRAGWERGGLESQGS